jgi:hypothetical protein
MGAWNGFSDEHCCPYFLDPTENLFNEIGTAFVAEVRSLLLLLNYNKTKFAANIRIWN